MDTPPIYISQTEVVFVPPKQLRWETAKFMVAHNPKFVYARYVTLQHAYCSRGRLYLKPLKIVDSIEFDKLFRFYTGASDYNPNRVVKVNC